MILQFVQNDYVIPNIYRCYEDFYYDTFMAKITKERPEFNVRYLEIDYLDRGVKSWKHFSKALLNKFPHLEALKFEQNYYYCNEDDWDSAETFFVNTGLKYLHITWFQEYEGKMFNKISNDSYYSTACYTDLE